MKKYSYTGKTKYIDGVTFRQIQATTDMNYVCAGDIGGWIEVDSNLSSAGNCWVDADAIVYGNSRITGNAYVGGESRVKDSHIIGNAHVTGCSVITSTTVADSARVCDDAFINKSMIIDSSKIKNNAIIAHSTVSGRAIIGLDGVIGRATDIITFGPVGSRADYVTFYRNTNDGVSVITGCFNDTIDKFITKVTTTHGNNIHARTYRLLADVAKLHILSN